MSEFLQGLYARPLNDGKPYEHQDYPKWVEPHASHLVVGANHHVSVPGFVEFFINRARNVTVLVKNEAEEAAALAAKVVEVPAEDVSDDSGKGGKDETTSNPT